MNACLRKNGFPVALAAHAVSATDAYVYGFVLSELNLPFDAAEGAESFAREIEQLLPVAEYPYLVEMITELVTGKDFAYADEFAFGLDLILDSLERHLAAEA